MNPIHPNSSSINFTNPYLNSSMIPSQPASLSTNQAYSHAMPLPLGQTLRSACEEDIQRLLGMFPDLPQFSSLLTDLLVLFVEYKMILLPLSDEKRTKHQEIQGKKEEIISECTKKGISLSPLDKGEPLIFQQIHEMAFFHVNHFLIQKKQELIQKWRPWIDSTQLSAQQLEELFAESQQETQLIEKINTKLSSLIAFAKLPNELHDLYRVSFEPSYNSERPFRIITGDNLLMGYSIHDLLYGIQIRNKSYEGEGTFDLNKDELQKLNTHLSALVDWIDDFTQIFAGLLGNADNTEHYLSVAQKPVSEILANPIRMSSMVIAHLNSKVQKSTPCLLLNQLSINLVDHPERDFLKAQLSNFFTLEHMIGANGQPKEFIHNDPYRTNLNLEQVKKIAPHLNKLLKFQQLILNFTGTSYLSEALETLKNWGVPNELQTMQQYKLQILFDTLHSILANQTPNDAYDQLNYAVSNTFTLESLEGKSLDLCETILSQFTGVFFQSTVALYKPTQQEIDALYNGPKNTTYEGNQRHRNITQLLTTLLNSPGFSVAAQKFPQLSEGLQELNNDLLHRLNLYHSLNPQGFYGKEMVDEAIRYLEHYVARVVYIDKSHVTQESIENSLIQLAGTVGQDWSRGCMTGLAGRLKNVLLSLSANTGNDLRDHFNEFKKECLEQAFLETAHNENYAESSMMVLDKGLVAQYLGIGDSAFDIGFDRLTDHGQQILKFFLKYYNPKSIYHKARSFFADKFWQLNKDLDDEGIYRLLQDLGFAGNTRADFDILYRVCGNAENRFQYAFFQQDLPKFLVAFLIKEKLLFARSQGGNSITIQKEGEMPFQFADQLPEANARDPIVPENNERQFGQIINSQLPTYQVSTS